MCCFPVLFLCAFIAERKLLIPSPWMLLVIGGILNCARVGNFILYSPYAGTYSFGFVWNVWKSGTTTKHDSGMIVNL